jgi:hypothetical protein
MNTNKTMTTPPKDPIKLAKALELARLDPKERFTKENITAIHEGLAPYYKELSRFELPIDSIVIGYGIDCWIYDNHYCNGANKNFDKNPTAEGLLYYCRRSLAEARGWIDPLPKPKFKGTLAECAQWCNDSQQCRVFKSETGVKLFIYSGGWSDMDGVYTLKDLTQSCWEEVSND